MRTIEGNSKKVQTIYTEGKCIQVHPAILELGVWDSRDNHGLSTKNFSVIGPIISKSDIIDRLSRCFLSHLGLRRVNYFLINRERHFTPYGFTESFFRLIGRPSHTRNSSSFNREEDSLSSPGEVFFDTVTTFLSVTHHFFSVTKKFPFT